MLGSEPASCPSVPPPPTHEPGAWCHTFAACGSESGLSWLGVCAGVSDVWRFHRRERVPPLPPPASKPAGLGWPGRPTCTRRCGAPWPSPPRAWPQTRPVVLLSQHSRGHGPVQRNRRRDKKTAPVLANPREADATHARAQLMDGRAKPLRLELPSFPKKKTAKPGTKKKRVCG